MSNCKPKCTIFKNWSGPECGEPAITMNDYGGFQCKFHTSIKRYEGNPPGSFKEIGEDSPEELQLAYNLFLQTHKDNSETIDNKVYVAAHNMPASMLRRGGKII